MITRETDYAIRAILCLAQDYGEGRVVSVSELARRMEIPFRFLRTLSRKLVAAKLVASKRGNGGGLTLLRPPKQISLMDVMRAVDSKSMLLNRCLLNPDDCARSAQCPVHGQLAGVQVRLEKMLAGLRFDKLSKCPGGRVPRQAAQ